MSPNSSFNTIFKNSLIVQSFIDGVFVSLLVLSPALPQHDPLFLVTPQEGLSLPLAAVIRVTLPNCWVVMDISIRDPSSLQLCSHGLPVSTN
jgi:hypothetical protein